MNVLVVGYGSAGKRHAINASLLGHRVYVHDSNGHREQQAEKDGIRVHDVTAGDLQAVVIATPVDSHADVARDLLINGYAGPLFVEKPLGLGTHEAIWSEWPHQTQCVGYNLRWNNRARAFIDIVSPVTHAVLALDCDMRSWPGTYGDFLLECSHEVDLALACGAEPTVTMARVDDANRRATIQLGSSTVRIEAHAARYGRYWHAIGPNGAATVNISAPSNLGTQMYFDEMAQFLEDADKQKTTRGGFADGLSVLRVCEQARSMTTGMVIR